MGIIFSSFLNNKNDITTFNYLWYHNHNQNKKHTLCLDTLYTILASFHKIWLLAVQRTLRYIQEIKNTIACLNKKHSKEFIIRAYLRKYFNALTKGNQLLWFPLLELVKDQMGFRLLNSQWVNKKRNTKHLRRVKDHTS